MAAPSSSSPAAAEASSDGPVLNLLTKRLRALRKKLNRIAQMEDALAQGKQLNPEQSEVLRSKPAVLALVDELDKLRAPLAVAVADEIALHTSPPPPPPPPAAEAPSLEDLVGLLYFSRLFDVQTQADFTATMLTRTHERGCCLTYDYVTDEAVELLGERDLDEISALGALVTSRPKAAAVSHRSALRECVEHARRWLENADQPVCADSPVTYAALREKLGKIMASDYCTATPEMKAPDDVAAAVGMYNSGLQVQVTEAVEVTDAEVPVDGSAASSEQKEDAEDNLQETELAPAQSSESSQVDDELPKDESDVSNHAGDIISDQQEQQTLEVDQEQNLRETESKEQQYLPRKPYQNTRGGSRGGSGFGGRRGYPNGRGGRGGRGGIYQNGRSQNYDPGYNQRGYYNPRGRGGGRFGGPGMANNYGPATQGPVPSYVE